jgi:hypothetical protein
VQGLKNRRLPVQYSPIPAKSNICNLEISFFWKILQQKYVKKLHHFFMTFGVWVWKEYETNRLLPVKKMKRVKWKERK